MIIKTYACDRCGLKEHDRIAPPNSVALSKIEEWKIDERTGSCFCPLCIQYVGVMVPCPGCKNEIKLIYDFDEFPIGDTEVRADCPYCNNITSFVYQKLPGR
jgi:hypothetical protein